MSVKLKAGQVVTIYLDPITKLKPEGDAKLVRELMADEEMPQWLVRFLIDGMTVERFIAL